MAQLTLLRGYPDKIGRRIVIVGNWTGPTSYVGGVGNGDVILGLPFQFYIDAPLGAALSTDGTTMGIVFPSGIGPRQTWKIRYFTFQATSPDLAGEVANATNLSTKSFQLGFLGGLY
jgi:hypothetical protein